MSAPAPVLIVSLPPAEVTVSSPDPSVMTFVPIVSMIVKSTEAKLLTFSMLEKLAVWEFACGVKKYRPVCKLMVKGIERLEDPISSVSLPSPPSSKSNPADNFIVSSPAPA